MQNLPASLKGQAQPLERCLRAMDAAMPLRTVYLFGSHVRGEARPDSDVDLCVVSDEADHQFAASRRLSEAVLDIWPRPALTLIPISPQRLREKQAVKDHFFATVLTEGVPIATEDGL
ncbi:MAG: nucleotidyltransferase domain-containing protein [Verrucomicrobia bacterium]|nr:nucleotidyltransferase domain-containing protein [Verrucomicrobiota bacterium]